MAIDKADVGTGRLGPTDHVAGSTGNIPPYPGFPALGVDKIILTVRESYGRGTCPTVGPVGY